MASKNYVKKTKTNNIAKVFIREDFYVDDGLLSRPDSNSVLSPVRDDNQEHTEAVISPTRYTIKSSGSWGNGEHGTRRCNMSYTCGLPHVMVYGCPW